jgi:hypothetical protein
MYFSDPQGTNYLRRFYRVRSQQGGCLIALQVAFIYGTNALLPGRNNQDDREVSDESIRLNR